jgi:hypothetical protein
MNGSRWARTWKRTLAVGGSQRVTVKGPSAANKTPVPFSYGHSIFGRFTRGLVILGHLRPVKGGRGEEREAGLVLDLK